MAVRLGGTYIEGDALHPAASIERMSAGIPLTDEDRWPWLEMVAQKMASQTGLAFAGYSALRKSYRTFLTDTANEPVSFIHLSGSMDFIAERMKSRTGHFMPPQLLDSQFAALELPDISERALTVEISGTQDEVIDTILNELKNRKTRGYSFRNHPINDQDSSCAP